MNLPVGKNVYLFENQRDKFFDIASFVKGWRYDYSSSHRYCCFKNLIVFSNPCSIDIFASHCNNLFALLMSGFRFFGSSSGSGSLKVIGDEELVSFFINLAYSKTVNSSTDPKFTI